MKTTPSKLTLTFAPPLSKELLVHALKLPNCPVTFVPPTPTSTPTPTQKKLAKRIATLIPSGIPRYVRCYETTKEVADRFTVCFTGKAAAAGSHEYPYLAMGETPFHPQGFCQYGTSQYQPCDTMHPIKKGWNRPPAVGRNHPNLGKRINFQNLPKDCQTAVLNDYRTIWDIEE